MNNKQINENLKSGDYKLIDSTLKIIRDEGNASVIKNLADLLINENNDFNKEIIEILSSLKDSQSVKEIMKIVNDINYLSIRQIILSTIWNTSLDYSEYLSDFVLIACNGNLMEAIDCLTIIENLCENTNEQQILESQLHLKNYYSYNKNIDEHKKNIISEIAIFIKNADWKIEG